MLHETNRILHACGAWSLSVPDSSPLFVQTLFYGSPVRAGILQDLSLAGRGEDALETGSQRWVEMLFP